MRLLFQVLFFMDIAFAILYLRFFFVWSKICLAGSPEMDPKKIDGELFREAHGKLSSFDKFLIKFFNKIIPSGLFLLVFLVVLIGLPFVLFGPAFN